MIVTRFAPSPTGRLHMGHAVSAILAHDMARAADGRFLLRIEDIDGTRSRDEHVATILDDLTWLGLAWDGPVVRQSARLDRYAAALERLREMGLLYRCYCTRAEIAGAMSAPHGPVAIYPGTCRGAGERDAPHCWRIDMAAAVARVGALAFTDHGRTIAADPLAQGDVVLARKDAPASYHLAVTVDDAAQGVTDVVRGRDLFAATHIHRLLQALLDLPVPRYHHHALLTGADGERLAKRHGAPTLAAMRAAGEDGRAVAARLRGR
ncbi:tRNA glutamyl-Q(34) synthetase GluQRS [Sphingomonas ginsenosidimutans]|uniref:tRNA glutamyl-Q(34) synthetase GluQRS n=1 Tax=Sphingomonas ginsenosidimutans TaxID=862134 RepID=A0A2A4HYW8_9SPHN|nr:tRNA glutamyl-Q(34) synthetase GluQRS [Sphingomonas ginsenosidimutans]MEE2915766.1 tRNA glutamyl-Q(34) synthetase GluQRS [Pseudomonadota bacterium]PCG09726.1 tRNA glutamyl-Q(34) synthetase GluQRS [Sphingomonas ginsenosidimutans]